MPWCYVCGNTELRNNHEKSEQHQLATAWLVVSDADAGYCAFCSLASGRLITLKSCRDLEHARELAEVRKLSEGSTKRDNSTTKEGMARLRISYADHAHTSDGRVVGNQLPAQATAPYAFARKVLIMIE